MKKTAQALLIVASMFFATSSLQAQSTTAKTNESTMKTYLIERDIPAAGKLTPEQLKAVS